MCGEGDLFFTSSTPDVMGYHIIQNHVAFFRNLKFVLFVIKRGKENEILSK